MRCAKIKKESGRHGMRHKKGRQLPASEMEQVLEGSLYGQLLEDGWVETAAPWVKEQELGPDGGNWMRLELTGRCQRLYEAWEERQRPA